MRKIFAGVVALATAVTISLTTAAPANAAYVSGTVANVSSNSSSYIYTSKSWPAVTFYALSPGFYRPFVAAFKSPRVCVSQWGYRYAANTIYPMTTSGQLNLDCD